MTMQTYRRFEMHGPSGIMATMAASPEEARSILRSRLVRECGMSEFEARKYERKTKMTITRQQFADLLDGIGSAWISSGAYTGSQPIVSVGSFIKAVADEIRASPTEVYEIPPVREGGK